MVQDFVVSAQPLFQTFQLLRDVVVPDDINSEIASVMAESMSGLVGIEALTGLVGGFASGQVAEVLHDEKEDSRFFEGASTGAFFGARRSVKSLALLLGLPTPIAVVAASVLGTVLCELVKMAGRVMAEAKQNERKAGVPAYLREVADLKISNFISAPEFVGDISKWLVFDLIISSGAFAAGGNGPSDYLIYFLTGAFSAELGNFVTEKLLENYSCPMEERESVKHAFQVSLEGGVLFSTYQFAMSMLQCNIPESLGHHKLLFSSILDNVISTVPNLGQHLLV